MFPEESLGALGGVRSHRMDETHCEYYSRRMGIEHQTTADRCGEDYVSFVGEGSEGVVDDDDRV